MLRLSLSHRGENSMDGVISSRRQVTIPKEVLQALKLQAGDRVRFEVRADGTVRLLAGEKRSVTSLKGMLPRPKRAVTLAEMDDAIARGASRR